MNKYIAKEPRGIAVPHLKEWRMHRVLTQLDLAARSGVANSTISYVEKGIKKAGPTTIGKLAQALELTREQLVHEKPAIIE